MLRRLHVTLSILLAFFLFSGCLSSVEIQKLEDQKIIPVKEGTKTKPVQFRKIVMKLKRGEKIGTVQGGLACIPHRTLNYRGGRNTLNSEELTEIFQEVLKANNYEVVGDPDALFEDPSTWKAEYFLVAGLVKSMKANICYPMAGFGNFSEGKGEASMVVDWQIYSRLSRKVVYEVSTEGYGEVEDSQPDGVIDVFLNSFSQATRNLLADQNFHELITGKGTIAEAIKPPDTIILDSPPLSDEPIANHINEIRLKVATVFAGDAHGTGFFIDRKGYLLTNEHVVRSAKYVKIKLTTGREILGEVVGSDSIRDIALIKSEETSIAGLPTRVDLLNVGTEVFAMGSPLDEKYGSTLSRGIISAYRSEDGLDFIQSDVNVLPGSSGGPLLDDNGNVIGITVHGIILGKAMTGLNFFIPIKEAFDTLNIQRK